MSRKSTDEILQKAMSLKADQVEFWRKALDGWGDEVDQLRVLGHASQAMVDLAQNELDAIKLQEDLEKPTKRIITAGWGN
jgi:CMP-2-keto-3-deoxyoctulosonic acid synthetase